MVPIKQNLVSSSKYSLKCPYAMIAEGITVHNTANNASAKNEVSYMINNDKYTSFHYAVDDIEIVQGVLENRNAFHAGDGNGKGNRKTLGIEICYSTGDRAKFEKAQENAAEFIAYKLKEKGWGVDKVYPHKHWSGKHCPHRTLDEYGWDYFINLVKKYLNGETGSNTKTTVTTVDITYQTWDDIRNEWLPNVVNNSDYAGIFGHDVCAIYANLSEGDCVYKVHIEGNDNWLPEVSNRKDYAGIFNKPIDGFMIKSTHPNIKIYYQVHLRGGTWQPYVSEYNESDHNNGYAGVIGMPIDGVRMYAKKTVTEIAQAVPPKPVASTPMQPEVKYFRVRTSWEDAKSQKGAYTSLENAIEKCQSLGEEYSVYDNDGNKVYSYVTPTPEPEPFEPEVTPLPVESEKKDGIEIKPDVIPAPIQPIPEPTPVEPEVAPQKPNTEEELMSQYVKPEEETDDRQVNIKNISKLLDIIEKIIKLFVKLFKKESKL